MEYKTVNINVVDAEARLKDQYVLNHLLVLFVKKKTFKKHFKRFRLYFVLCSLKVPQAVALRPYLNYMHDMS